MCPGKCRVKAIFSLLSIILKSFKQKGKLKGGRGQGTPTTREDHGSFGLGDLHVENLVPFIEKEMEEKGRFCERQKRFACDAHGWEW